jgi:hypothetical protein
MESNKSYLLTRDHPYSRLLSGHFLVTLGALIVYCIAIVVIALILPSENMPFEVVYAVIFATGLTFLFSNRSLSWHWHSAHFQRLDLTDHCRTYGATMQLTLPGLKMDKGLNMVIFHHRPMNHVVVTMGLEIIHVATQIHPNYQDILRKISKLAQNLPFTINSVLNDGPGISYRFFLTAHAETAGRGDLQRLIMQIRQNLIAFWPVLQTNFPHFGFAVLTDMALCNALQAPFHVNRIAQAQKDGSKWKRWFREFIICGVIGSNIAYGYLLTRSYWVFLGIGLIIYHCVRSWDAFSSISALIPIDLFPNCTWLRSRNTAALILTDPIANSVQTLKIYQIQEFNPHFNLIPAKFYRACLSQFLGSPMRLTSAYYCQRAEDKTDLVMQIGPEYTDPEAFLGSHLGIWDCHAFFYALHEQTGVESFLKSPHDAARIEAEITERMSPLFAGFFANTPMIDITASAEALFYSIDKSVYGRSAWRHTIPNPLIYGDKLIPYIQTPEELHRFCRASYPGEFSSPRLTDEIELGRVYNCENHTEESPAGLTQAELMDNIFIGGTAKTEVIQLTAHGIDQLLHYNKPMLILDSDGDLAVRVKKTHPEILQLVFGVDFGINLFDPSRNQPNDALYAAYLERIFTIIGLIWQRDWTPADLATLKSCVLRFASEKKSSLTLQTLKSTYATDTNGKGGAITQAFLDSLNQNYLNHGFDSPLDRSVGGGVDQEKINLNSLSPEQFFMDRTIIINFGTIPAGQLRSLAIEAFLAHLPFLQLECPQPKNDRDQ